MNSVQSAPSNHITRSREVEAERLLLAIIAERLAAGDEAKDIPYSCSENFREPREGVLRSCVRACLHPEFEREVQAVFAQHCPGTCFDSRQFVTSMLNALVETEALRMCVANTEAIENAVHARDGQAVSRALRHAHESVRDFMAEFYVFNSDSGQRLSADDFNSGAANIFRVRISARDDNHGYGNFEKFYNLYKAVRGGGAWLSILNDMPHADQSQIARDRATYGAKAANLMALDRLSQAAQPLLCAAGLEFQVPPFAPVPLAVFDKFKSGQDVSSDLRSYFEWIDGREVVVRSSALRSEDAEHLGAGVYRTVRLKQGADFETFMAAVAAVYESTDSNAALWHRREIGLATPQHESMGLIIQEFKQGASDEPAGHIDTIRPHMPHVVNVVVEERELPAFRTESDQDSNIESRFMAVAPLSRVALERNMCAFSPEPDCFLLRLDPKRVNVCPDEIADLGRLSIVLELHFGQPLQLEYVRTGHRTFIVQARPLPPLWIEPASADFPSDLVPLWVCESFGVIDRELEILAEDLSNYEKDGILILNSQRYGSFDAERIAKIIPKSGAVFLLSDSDNEGGLGGHVESYCAERGIVVLKGSHVREVAEAGCDQYFKRFWEAYGHDASSRLYGDAVRGPTVLVPSDRLKRLRVVSNGLEARIYEVSESQPSNERESYAL